MGDTTPSEPCEPFEPSEPFFKTHAVPPSPNGATRWPGFKVFA